MRALASVCTLMMAAIALMLQTGNAAADVSPTEGSLTIYGFYGDAVRPEDHKGVDVSESIFFNNSGSQTFAGNISLWVQQDAYIASPLCGSQRNQVARIEAGPKLTCHPLQIIDSENYKFKPFSAAEFLSYYGERHTVALNASSPNGSAQFDLNVTLGAPTVPSTRQVYVGEVSVNTTSDRLGAQAQLTWAPPRNLTVRQSLNLSNHGGTASTVAISILNLPAGWTATLWRGTTRTNSVQVPAGQYVDVVLNVTAPSYLLQAYVEYSLPGTDNPSGESSVTITKTFPYNVTYVEFWVYAQTRDDVSVTGDLEVANESVWNSTAQRFIYPAYGFNIIAGDVTTIFVVWKPPPFEMPLWAMIVIVLLVVMLIAFPLLRKRRLRKAVEEAGEERAADETELPKQPPMTIAQLREKSDILRKSLERLTQDEKEGVTPKDILAKMRQEVETELAGIEQQLGVLSTATARKKAILKALRNLERDHKEGKVDSALYASMKARYEKEAVAILRQIEEMKERGADEIEEE